VRGQGKRPSLSRSNSFLLLPQVVSLYKLRYPIPSIYERRNPT
jgi:hypothetical protein